RWGESRGGRSANGDFDGGIGRAVVVCQLHQRSSGVEGDVSNRFESEARAAVAGVGDRRQYGGSGLGEGPVVAGGGRAAIVRAEFVATVLFAQASRAAAAGDGGRAANLRSDADFGRWKNCGIGDRSERSRNS